MTETAFRTFGGLLGLVGVLLVAYELDAAIGQYSPMHSAVRRTARRLRRLWGWLIMTYRRLVGQQPEPTVVGAMAASTSATAGRARGMVTPPKREHDDFDTDDERVRHLFDRVNSAHEWIGVVREKADADRARCRERHDHLAVTLADTDQRWRQKIRDVEAGQAGMRFSGFICLGFGVLSTSWADELSRWDPPAFGLLIVALLSTLVGVDPRGHLRGVARGPVRRRRGGDATLRCPTVEGHGPTRGPNGVGLPREDADCFV